MKTILFSTPKAPAEIEAVATLRSLKNGINCPVCGKLYGDNDQGFLAEPCEHLVAHYGPYGWEKTPHNSSVECVEGDGAFRVIALLAMYGNPVMKVTSGNEGTDVDWLVWKPAVLNSVA